MRTVTTDAEVYLERIEKINCLIINKWEDHQRWMSIAQGSGGSSGGDGGSSRNIDKTQNAIIKYMSLDTEIDELKNERREIIGNIEKLPILEYKILYALYVSGLTIKEIVHKEKLSYESVKKHKKIGLRLIRDIINVPKDTPKYPEIPKDTHKTS